MRSPVAYYLLLLYLTAMLRPLIPIVADAWSHTFDEAIHIATIHAKYGNNHLEKELAGSEKENNKAQNTVKSQEPVPVHIIKNNYVYSIDFKFIVQQYILFVLINPAAIIISLQVPPPKFS